MSRWFTADVPWPPVSDRATTATAGHRREAVGAGVERPTPRRLHSQWYELFTCSFCRHGFFAVFVVSTLPNMCGFFTLHVSLRHFDSVMYVEALACSDLDIFAHS